MTYGLLKPVALVFAALLAYLVWQNWLAPPQAWSVDEISMLRSLALESLPDLPPDPSNAVADSPAAVVMGAQLFTDTRLSANGEIACATCHQPERRFSDGLPKGQGIGTSGRNTPSIVGSAYSPWLYWDGRRDSQWSQALSPLEDPNEHGTDRRHIVRIIGEDETYRATYESLFGPMPDFSSEEEKGVNAVFANVGKIIAAFERTLMPTASRFDRYVAAVLDGNVQDQSKLYSNDEIRGLRLFIGDAQCTQCHNGPLLTNHEFHNTGVINHPGDVPDIGRAKGARDVVSNEFNCLSSYSDDEKRRCAELEFIKSGVELIGAVRTPSLRNLVDTEPYMHKGQLATLIDVLEHYNDAPDAMVGHNEAEPLGLSSGELRQLEAFLQSLAAPFRGDLSN